MTISERWCLLKNLKDKNADLQTKFSKILLSAVVVYAVGNFLNHNFRTRAFLGPTVLRCVKT